jgi:hypothetical protein
VVEGGGGRKEEGKNNVVIENFNYLVLFGHMTTVPQSTMIVFPNSATSADQI